MERIPESCSRVSVPCDGGRLVATPVADRAAWVIRYPDGQRFYLPLSGGRWELAADGALGRQTDGTCDEQAPASPSRMRSYLLAVA